MIAPVTRLPRRSWIGLLLVFVLGAAGAGAQAPAVPALLVSADSGARVPTAVSSRIDTLQSRPVNVAMSALAAATIDIELTSGRVVRAELDRRESHRNGAQTWSGHVVGEPLSSVTLVSRDGVVQGSVRLLDASYSIEPAEGGPLHLVRLVDTDATGVELEPLRAEPEPAAPADEPIGNDDGTTFDVFVAYTPAARTAAGGTDLAVQNRIALGVSETNTAYANSGITPRLRLLGAELTNYVESGDLSIDLTRFRTTTDGVMDEVHTRRDALGADLMVLVVGDAAAGACGVGYVMTSLSGGFASSAFSVSAFPCISPNYTFAHELGHNMGSAHAPEDGTGQASLFPYSFGYKHPSNLFRTVMAYNCPVNCPRVLHFSNPGVTYSGAPTGTVSQHDNVRSINSAALTISNWRQATGGGTPPTISAISNLAINEDSSSAPIAFTIGDSETSASSLTVTASSGNTTLVPNTLAALAFGGSGASRTLVVTPAANRSGTAVITVTVSDGSLTATRTFTLTVNAVNDAPTLTASPSSATIANGQVAHTIVTVTDVDTSGANLSLTTSSSNTVLLPNANIGVATTGTTASGRTFDVSMTPAAGQAGTAVVTLTASDGTATTPTTYSLTVTIPVPPTISPVTPQSTDEDTPITVDFTVNDADTPLSALTVQASSSNTLLVPASGLETGGIGSTRTVRITPSADRSGTSTITLTVDDGLATAQTSFVLTVVPVDDPPSFAAGAPTAISTVVSTPTSFPVTITDPDTPGATLTLTGSSSNPVVVTPSGLAIVPTSSTATSRTFDVTVTPVTGAIGTTALGLLAHDAASSAGRAVQLTVTASPGPPDAPTALTAAVTGSTLTLSWTPPTTGSTPTSYSVHIGNAPGATTLPVQTTAGTSIGVPIATGGLYYARVRAVNTYGTSGPSPEVSVSVAAPNPRPGPPQNLTGSFTGRTVFLSWTAPTTGDPVVSYQLEVGTAPGLANLVVAPVGAATSFSAPGVPDGTFWVRVRGVNAAGLGTPSSDLGLAVGPAGGCAGLPLAPTFRSPIVGGSAVALGWDPPASGPAPVSYVLTAGTAPGRSDIVVFDLGSPAPSFNTSAPPGTYFLRVAGRSVCGVGAPSNEVTLVVAPTSIVPVAPTGLVASVTGNVVSLLWNPPASGGTPTAYQVEAGSTTGGMNLAVINTGNTLTSLSGAVPPGRYFIRVRTRTGSLVSPPSNEVMVTVP